MSVRRRELAVARAAAVIALSTGLCTLVGHGLRAVGMSEAGVVQVFPVGVALTALLVGRVGAALAAGASVLAFNFFFVEPVHTFAVADPENLLIFGVLLVTGMVLSELVARLRIEARSARERADSQHVLLAVGTLLARARGVAEVLSAAADSISLELRRRVQVELSTGLTATATGVPAGERVDRSGADPYAGSLSVELPGSGGQRLGALRFETSSETATAQESDMARALAGMVALALERELHAEDARRVAVEIERERLRGDLLSTVSHDLRTPLAVISSSASVLLDSGAALGSAERALLLRQVRSEAERLTRLVENLLHLGRLDEGPPSLTTDLYPLQELVEGALARLAGYEGEARVEVDLPEDPLWVRVDADLIVNALVNLVDNALRYGSTGEVVLASRLDGGGVEIAVEDDGPGFVGDPAAYLARFVRGPDRRQRGSGLGLAICAAIARAHGGELAAANRPTGGARVALRLPAAVPRTTSQGRGEPIESGRHA